MQWRCWHSATHHQRTMKGYRSLVSGRGRSLQKVAHFHLYCPSSNVSTKRRSGQRTMWTTSGHGRCGHCCPLPLPPLPHSRSSCPDATNVTKQPPLPSNTAPWVPLHVRARCSRSHSFCHAAGGCAPMPPTSLHRPTPPPHCAPSQPCQQRYQTLCTQGHSAVAASIAGRQEVAP